MATPTIGMEDPQAIAVFHRSQGSGVIAFMAMLMMSEMLCERSGRLMPAICCGRTPDELELHHEQHEDDQPASHGADSK